MVKMTGKLSIRGGPLLNVGDCYTGPHERWIMENQLGERIEEPNKPREPQGKAPSAPPNNKMVKEGKTWKKS